MGEGGQGGDKRKGEGQERKIVDVGGDIKKVKSGKKERVGHISFYVGEQKRREKSKIERN